MEETAQKQIEEIKETDLLIGILTYNNARTIGPVVQSVSTGLARFFPQSKGVIFNSDAGSTDRTQEEMKKVPINDLPLILTSHSVHPIHKIATPYHGIPGQENAYRAFWETAKSLGAKACTVVDADLKSITPEWMEILLRPIYEGGFDYVAPLFARPKFDGTMTNSIVYPLTRALYGQQVRQPIGGNSAFSGGLANFYLGKAVWESEVIRLGIDLWMTTLAIGGGYKICQSHLGCKIHEAKESASDLATMFSQVVSSVYALMGEYQNFWKEVKASQPIPTSGSSQEMATELFSVNWQRMMQIFRLGVKDLTEVWRRVLPGGIVLGLEAIGRLSEEAFSFPPDLWVRTVYGFAVAYHKRSLHREHLLKSMVPLYLGWIASFIKENQKASTSEVEEKIESLCRIYEEMKPYLLERWA